MMTPISGDKAMPLTLYLVGSPERKGIMLGFIDNYARTMREWGSNPVQTSTSFDENSFAFSVPCRLP